MDEIEDYTPPASSVQSVGDGTLDLYFADELPTHGEAVAIRTGDDTSVYGCVLEHLGGRRVRVLVGPLPESVGEGSAVEATGRRAGFSAPPLHSVDITPDLIQPEGADDWVPLSWRQPEFAELDARRPALATGLEGLDAIAPLAAGGTNLIIDTSNDAGRNAARSFDSLVERLRDFAADDAVIWAPCPSQRSGDQWVDHPVGKSGLQGHDHLLALRLATALAAHRRDASRDTLALLELPAVGRAPGYKSGPADGMGYGDIIDLMGTGLTSTDGATVTSLLYLPVPAGHSGIDAIVETLNLGEVDAQIVVDDEGRFAPRRSTSRAEQNDEQRRRRDRALKTMRLAEKARDKAALLGETELTEDERAALDRIDRWRDALVDS